MIVAPASVAAFVAASRYSSAESVTFIITGSATRGKRTTTPGTVREAPRPDGRPAPAARSRAPERTRAPASSRVAREDEQAIRLAVSASEPAALRTHLRGCHEFLSGAPALVATADASRERATMPTEEAQKPGKRANERPHDRRSHARRSES